MSFLDAKSHNTLFALPELYEEAPSRFELSSEDVAYARSYRRSHNRFGFAIQLVLIRDLGRTLRAGKVPTEAVIAVVAEQLDIDPAVFTLYARREETRREHAREIVSALGLRYIRVSDYRMLILAAAGEATTTERGLPITRAVIDKLKDKKLLVPVTTQLIRLAMAGRVAAPPAACPTGSLSGIWSLHPSLHLSNCLPNEPVKEAFLAGSLKRQRG